MELRSVAYNPAPTGMAGMQMPGMQMPGMQMPGMAQMPGAPMAGAPGMVGAPGMYHPLPPSGMVNLDVDVDPGLVTLDLGGPMPCPPAPMYHHCPPPVPAPAPVPTPAHEVYVVKKGDTVYKIAKRYGTTMQAIILGNNLRNPDLIYPGQVLIIPGV